MRDSPGTPTMTVTVELPSWKAVFQPLAIRKVLKDYTLQHLPTIPLDKALTQCSRIPAFATYLQIDPFPASHCLYATRL